LVIIISQNLVLPNRSKLLIPGASFSSGHTKLKLVYDLPDLPDPCYLRENLYNLGGH
jgi:hypothetical protein